MANSRAAATAGSVGGCIRKRITPGVSDGGQNHRGPDDGIVSSGKSQFWNGYSIMSEGAEQPGVERREVLVE